MKNIMLYLELSSPYKGLFYFFLGQSSGPGIFFSNDQSQEVPESLANQLLVCCPTSCHSCLDMSEPQMWASQSLTEIWEGETKAAGQKEGDTALDVPG